ncbi:MAG: formylglycine-generating enzyme family protein [Pacificimonas sp.]
MSLQSGTLRAGEGALYPEEGPERDITVSSFAIDVHEVTNDQFGAFVAATGYVTEAEQPPPDLPEAPPEMRQPGSALFTIPTPGNPSWWRWQSGAAWRSPEGPGSNLDGRGDHPVVHVTLRDAEAYADWAGAALPTAAEWEYAARGGLDGASYEWGDEQRPGGAHRANSWQGVFPVQDTGADGHEGLAPVGCYDANGYGLHDMTGNVWELTATPTADGTGSIIKGGSFLCADNYCRRDRPAAWQAQERGLGTNHIGFRTIVREPEA